MRKSLSHMQENNFSRLFKSTAGQFLCSFGKSNLWLFHFSHLLLRKVTLSLASLAIWTLMSDVWEGLSPASSNWTVRGFGSWLSLNTTTSCNMTQMNCGSEELNCGSEELNCGIEELHY